MTNEEIIEGNRIICVFMGGKIVSGAYKNGCKVPIILDGFAKTTSNPTYELPEIPDKYDKWSTRRQTIDNLAYHLNWNQLMPVYIKIVREMEDIDVYDDLTIEFIVLYDRVGDGDGILAVWEHVIEWIKCYNNIGDGIKRSEKIN
jgi:hypothetical protein